MCEFEAHALKIFEWGHRASQGEVLGTGTQWNLGQQSVVLCAHMRNAV